MSGVGLQTGILALSILMLGGCRLTGRRDYQSGRAKQSGYMLPYAQHWGSRLLIRKFLRFG